MGTVWPNRIVVEVTPGVDDPVAPEVPLLLEHAASSKDNAANKAKDADLAVRPDAMCLTW